MSDQIGKDAGTRPGGLLGEIYDLADRARAATTRADRMRDAVRFTRNRLEGIA